MEYPEMEGSKSMADTEQINAWRANGLSDVAQLDWHQWRVAGMIVRADDGREAYVRRHGRYLWSLNVLPSYPRNRWGNATDIASDVAFFQANGRLPAPVGDRW